MTESQRSRPKPILVYTPELHIPIGEPTVLDGDNPALIIKFKDRAEAITLDSLVSLVETAIAKKQ